MSPWFCSCLDARRIASFHNIDGSSVSARTRLVAPPYRANGLVLWPIPADDDTRQQAFRSASASRAATGRCRPLAVVRERPLSGG